MADIMQTAFSIDKTALSQREDVLENDCDISAA